VVLLVTADQVSKMVAQARLGSSPPRTVVFISGVLSFTYRENPGGPFSLLAQSRWAWVLAPLAVVATGAIIWWLFRSQMRSWLEGLACALIVGGALGNLMDRLSLGAVRDFLKLTCIRWPVFNLADAFISVGVGLLLLVMLLGGASPALSPSPSPSPSGRGTG
jgi:signal peptidase II